MELMVQIMSSRFRALVCKSKPSHSFASLDLFNWFWSTFYGSIGELELRWEPHVLDRSRIPISGENELNNCMCGLILNSFENIYLWTLIIIIGLIWESLLISHAFTVWAQYSSSAAILFGSNLTLECSQMIRTISTQTRLWLTTDPFG